MNRFLYKYMPMRAGFFEDPMIRATPVMALNDPFEGAFNEQQVKDADRNQTDFYKQNGKQTYEFDEYELNGIAGDIQMDLFGLGVISLTEDYNNPLMWAHYADEHKGCVVEFDFSKPFFMDSIFELNGRPSRFGKSYLGDTYEFPEKVDYRRVMPDFSRKEQSAPDDLFEFHWNKFNRTILYTKSNDWIYEKEQRIVVPLRHADSIICKDDEYVRSVCNQDKNIKVVELGNDKIQIYFPHEYEMHEDMGDQSIKDEIYHLTNDINEPAVHLFRLNSEAISGVYFGCKSKFYEALDNINSNVSLEHLEHKYKMERSNTLYQLDKVKLE
ncbi:DUF2971 domain-containing protein [Vibrio vulnificus]|nr:DUF2971 domain-containing protein [Vibrio vulnificus]MBM4850980.1 DUF2971 domain-containing protein [Vibrio parahaemolyticus]HBC3436619.1 DUF2971 domain-containing protein [Vibrio parahaemolyticus]HBH7866870.1 DUF2971 domain-containing protein [Vibrio parahaemolyticus]